MKRDRKRIYYKSISVQNVRDNQIREYKVGDTVNMAGGEERWVAQIIDLFQVTPRDPELRQLLRTDSVKNESKHHYELKRCTLRWFYNLSDMDHNTMKKAKWPKSLEGEVWFSDHVEEDGSNSVQVIDGRAWIFATESERTKFLKDPPSDYNENRDKIRIVRGYVDSTRDHLPLRHLAPGELRWLLDNPSPDKNLYENSKLRFAARTKSPSPTKKRKPKPRHTTIREPVNVDEDEFEPEESKPSRDREHKKAVRSQHHVAPLRKRPPRRMKITVDDDEETASNDRDDESRDDIPLSMLKPHGQDEDIDQVNDEVRDLVHKLNASAFADEETPIPTSEIFNHSDEPVVAEPVPTVPPEDEDQITPAPVSRLKKRRAVSEKPKPPASKLMQNEVIVLDSDDEEPFKTTVPLQKPKLQRFHTGAANRAYRGGRHGRPSAKNRSSFMPTSKDQASHLSRKKSDTLQTDKKQNFIPAIPDLRTKEASKTKDPMKVDRGSKFGIKDRRVSTNDHRSTVAASRNNVVTLDDNEGLVLDQSVGKDASSRGTKRTTNLDDARHRLSPKRRALSSSGAKPKPLRLRTTEDHAGIEDVEMQEVVLPSPKSPRDSAVRDRVQSQKQDVGGNAIKPKSDPDVDDAEIQKESRKALHAMKGHKKALDNIHRIYDDMNDIDQEFIWENLEWLIEESLRFHKGEKGSVNLEEYERILRDRLLAKRKEEIGSLSELPVFKSDPSKGVAAPE